MKHVLPSGLEEPVRIVSDLHLGHPSSMLNSVRRLRPLIEGAKTVVFNGDTCELAHSRWRDRSEQLLGELGALCEELGVRPVFLTGNHDYAISESGWLELAGGAVMVTHGDMLLSEVVPWSHQFLGRKRAVRELLDSRAGADTDLASRWQTVRMVEELLAAGFHRKPATMRWLGYLGALWPPERCVRILEGWLTMFDVAERFVQRYCPEVRVFVFGHFHRAGVRIRGGRLYCNTGAAMSEARQTVVELDGGWLTIRPVVRRDGEWSLGPVEDVFRLS